jgi:hypothetical protein
VVAAAEAHLRRLLALVDHHCSAAVAVEVVDATPRHRLSLLVKLVELHNHTLVLVVVPLVQMARVLPLVVSGLTVTPLVVVLVAVVVELQSLRLRTERMVVTVEPTAAAVAVAA